MFCYLQHVFTDLIKGEQMKVLMIALLASFLASQTLQAKEYQLGAILGAPTGLSGKVVLGNNRSVDAALAYSLADDLDLTFHMDYLVENAHKFSIKAASPLALYFGLGVRLAVIDGGRHDDDIAIGPRLPIGLSYDMNNPNLQFFGELAMILNLVPDTNVDVDAGIGARYRF